MTTDDRSEYRISKEVALERLDIIPDYDQGNGPEPHVHTFRQAGPALLGAHWTMEQVEQSIDQFGIEEAGDAANEMGHGLVIIDGTGPCFLATKMTGDSDE